MRTRELELLVPRVLLGKRVKLALCSHLLKLFFFYGRIIPNLYFPQDSCKESTLVNKAIQDKNHLLEMLDDRFVDTSLSKRAFVQNMPFPFCVIETLPCENVNGSLSRIVLMLHKHLLTTASKYLIVLRFICRVYEFLAHFCL